MRVLLCLIIVLLLSVVINAANSKSKTLSRKLKILKRDCEREKCSTVLIEDPNCVYECMSAACFAQIFAENPLEPGEIDHTRNKEFQACFREEDRLIKQKKMT